MKKISDLQVNNKKVLLRSDLDVPLNEDGKILDDFRIKRALPTIKYLIGKQAKIIIIGHLGRPQEERNAKRRERKFSLEKIAERIELLLGEDIIFVKDCIGKRVEKTIETMGPGQIVLLENLRFYPEEEANDVGFAKQLASLGEIYINDAFSVCHREHASIVGLPKLLPSGAGLTLADEIKILDSILLDPKRPLVAILGGAKIETKIPCLFNLLSKADHILIGGKIAPAILAAKRISISAFPLSEQLENDLSKIEITNPKLHMPIDALVGLKNHQPDYLRESAVGKIRSEEQMFDIGPESVRIFSSVVAEAKTIIWNGPLGFIEDERFASGTLTVASAILRSGAFSVVGGGETNGFLAQNNLRDKFSHISTGGGAMLEFLSGKALPGIEALT